MHAFFFYSNDSEGKSVSFPNEAIFLRMVDEDSNDFFWYICRMYLPLVELTDLVTRALGLSSVEYLLTAKACSKVLCHMIIKKLEISWYVHLSRTLTREPKCISIMQLCFVYICTAWLYDRKHFMDYLLDLLTNIDLFDLISFISKWNEQTWSTYHFWFILRRLATISPASRSKFLPKVFKSDAVDCGSGSPRGVWASGDECQELRHVSLQVPCRPRPPAWRLCLAPRGSALALGQSHCSCGSIVSAKLRSLACPQRRPAHSARLPHLPLTICSSYINVRLCTHLSYTSPPRPHKYDL